MHLLHSGAFVLIAMASFTSCAEAKQKAPPVEYVDPSDAVRSLAAKLAYDHAIAEVEIKRLAWLGEQAAFNAKYRIKIEDGDGWDEENGKLKLRRGK